MSEQTYQVRLVGWVESPLTDLAAAPKQGDEGSPVARIVLAPDCHEAAKDLRRGDAILVLTWLHRGDRDVRAVHPRGDLTRPMTGVFATRSPDRPNPIGLHAVVIEAVEEGAISVRDLEAIDGTPVLDIKPVLGKLHER